MTNQNFLKNLKTKLAIILAIICVFCTSVFVFTACNENEDASLPSYSYTDEKDENIANPNFTANTVTKDYSAFPIVSASSWTKKYHNVAISSYVDSGVINVSTPAWEVLSKKLSEDNDLIKALRYQYRDKVTDLIRTEKSNPSYNPTDDEIDSYLKTNFADFYANPGVPNNTTAKDGKLYMLNNYPQNSTYIGKGTAQTITSSTNVTMEKGKYSVVSVWVKTINITGDGDSTYHGANIRLENKIAGSSQAEYRISSINTQGEWKQYNLYILADKDYTTTFTLSLGLGYGLGSNTSCELYTQGTVFFDDISYKVVDPSEVDETSFNGKIENLVFGQEEYYETYATDTNTNYCYKMNMSYKDGYFKTVTEDYNSSLATFTDLNDKNDDTADYFTYSNITDKDGKPISSKTNNAYSTINIERFATSIKATLNQASASIKVNDPTEFTVNPGEYKIVTLKVLNKLFKKTSSVITFDLYDVYDDNGTKIVEKRAQQATISEPSEDVSIITFIIENNFETDTRSFYLVVNIGPTDVASVSIANNFASGNVTISDVKVATGLIDDEEDADGYNKYYEFLSTNANASLSLYAGWDSVPTDEEDEKITHSLETKPSDFGLIKTAPANLKNYEGVVSNHHYIISNGENSSIDTRSGMNGDGNGNYAGLINSEYLSTYDTNLGINVTNAIGNVKDEIQPLMIYNSQPDSYGYISEKHTISSNTYASISLNVRVTGDAVAYIYLVDVSKVEKNVVKFGTFTPNVSKDEVGQYMVDNNNTNGGYELMMKVDSTTLTNANEEWVKINFYVATGESAINFRLEVWNGGRDGHTNSSVRSQGFVFFNDIEIKTSDGFVESPSWKNALYNDTKNPLNSAEFDFSATSTDQLIAYKQKLTATEKQFNSEYPDQAVSYPINYIWAKNDTMLYAVYNTIDPIEIDPYDTLLEEEEENESCATGETDPSTFWLTFSTIVLAAALFFAIAALIIKNVLRKRKANKNDAKSHYKVTSRIKTEKKAKDFDNTEKEIAEYKSELDKKIAEDSQEEETEETSNEQVIEESQIDSYVYGDVIENFTENVEHKEETNDSNEEKTSDNN